MPARAENALILQTFTNFALLVLAPTPSILYCAQCGADATIWEAHRLCILSDLHPLILVNILFFVNVCVLFWLLSLLQGSTWLIDPYWTILPVLIAHLYSWACLHGKSKNLRQLVALSLIWLWSIRLTQSYFRREKWELGAREDWRYADMRARWGKAWPLLSFFAVYLIQQGMLVGLTLPLYTVFASHKAWRPIADTIASIGCLIGIGMAALADNQLHDFMEGNERRRAAGQKPELLLDTGLWRYSRHPNYFFEQLFWWSLALFGANVGAAGVFVGPLFNSMCMVQVTRLTEERMMRRPERAGLYSSYTKRTSVWIPMPVLEKHEQA